MFSDINVMPCKLTRNKHIMTLEFSIFSVVYANTSSCARILLSTENIDHISFFCYRAKHSMLNLSLIHI